MAASLKRDCIIDESVVENGVLIQFGDAKKVDWRDCRAWIILVEPMLTVVFQMQKIRFTNQKRSEPHEQRVKKAVLACIWTKGLEE
jgi:hypothetical protein